MKTIIGSILGMTLSGMILIGFWGYIRHLTEPGSAIQVKDVGPTIEKIQSLGHLAVLKISVSDVLVAESNSFKGFWLVKGDALLMLDFRHAGFQDKDEKTKTATIILPPLEVMQPRVDHSKTLTWNIQKTTWVPWKNDDSSLRDQAMAEAQRLVEHAVKLPEYINQGKDNAEILIKNMYKMVDWSIAVQWKADDEPTQSRTKEAISPP